MPFIEFETFSEAKTINARITAECIAKSKWTDGVTNNYCNPYLDEETQLWVVPVLEGYENFFTDEELAKAR